MQPLNIYVGYDSREDIASRVAYASMFYNTKHPINIFPLDLKWLREHNLYWREVDPMASTEFAFSRFLVPHLNDYRGWALFCDCDFMFRRDISKVLDYRDDNKALYVVKHDYKPTESLKMDGKTQTQYPRKNWSSFMWINCGHEQVKRLTLDVVNRSSGLYLHQFKWLTDDVIGELPLEYNYLEGWNTREQCADPTAVHFTRGGPWFNEFKDVEYASEWNKYASTAPHSAG
jgi:lipopolysaccharide biosynthesis glycosyltransferase